MGQIIKEMRDVEQRLGKPETGEDTQAKQKQNRQARSRR